MSMDDTLRAHRLILGEYAAVMKGLQDLRDTKPDDSWYCGRDGGGFTIPLPPDIAQRLLADEIRRTEARMQELATRLRESAAALAPEGAKA